MGESEETIVKRGACPVCGLGCHVEVDVRDGTALRIKKDMSMEKGMELVLSLVDRNFAPEIVEVFENVDLDKVRAGFGENHNGYDED